MIGQCIQCTGRWSLRVTYFTRKPLRFRGTLRRPRNNVRCTTARLHDCMTAWLHAWTTDTFLRSKNTRSSALRCEFHGDVWVSKVLRRWLIRPLLYVAICRFDEHCPVRPCIAHCRTVDTSPRQPFLQLLLSPSSSYRSSFVSLGWGCFLSGGIQLFKPGAPTLFVRILTPPPQEDGCWLFYLRTTLSLS